MIGQEWTLGPKWPGEEVLRQLVLYASGLFIWAATACRFIREGEQFAHKRLDKILEGTRGAVIAPEKHLDEIYTTVLKHSISPMHTEEEKEDYCVDLRHTLGSVLVLLSPLSASSLNKLLNFPKEKVSQTLKNLHAILDIQEDQTCPLRLHHPSFRDFLISPQRCCDPNFWVEEKNAHEALANHCMQLMSQKLNQKDLCGLRDPGARIAQVSSEKLARYLPEELQYACEYWVSHLQRSNTVVDDESRAHRFLREYCVQCLQQRREDDTSSFSFPLNHWLHWVGAFALSWGKDLIQRLQTNGRYLNHDAPVCTRSRHHWLPWLGAFGLWWAIVWMWWLQRNSQFLQHDALVYAFSPHHWLPWLGALGLGCVIIWFWRLQPSRQSLDDGGPVHIFMQQHFLYWLEALSLVGKISEGVRAIQLLEDMVDVRML
jgi:hypothetical protein